MPSESQKITPQNRIEAIEGRQKARAARRRAQELESDEAHELFSEVRNNTFIFFLLSTGAIWLISFALGANFWGFILDGYRILLIPGWYVLVWIITMCVISDQWDKDSPAKQAPAQAGGVYGSAGFLTAEEIDASGDYGS